MSTDIPNDNVPHISSNLDADDLTIYNAGTQHFGGGFSINSSLLKRGKPPLVFAGENEITTGGSNKSKNVSDLFNQFVIPAGLMSPELGISFSGGGQDDEPDDYFDDLGSDFELDSSDDGDESVTDGEDEYDIVSLNNEETNRDIDKQSVVPDTLFDELFKLSVQTNPIERNVNAAIPKPPPVMSNKSSRPHPAKKNRRTRKRHNKASKKRGTRKR